MLVLSTFIFQAKFYLNFKFVTQQLKDILVQFFQLLFAICFNGITVFFKRAINFDNSRFQFIGNNFVF